MSMPRHATNLQETWSASDSHSDAACLFDFRRGEYIDNLSEKLFNIKKELTTVDNNSDYEIEIRYLIDQLRGDGTASHIFPKHIQSRVIGWRENE